MAAINRLGDLIRSNVTTIYNEDSEIQIVPTVINLDSGSETDSDAPKNIFQQNSILIDDSDSDSDVQYIDDPLEVVNMKSKIKAQKAFNLFSKSSEKYFDINLLVQGLLLHIMHPSPRRRFHLKRQYYHLLSNIKMIPNSGPERIARFWHPNQMSVLHFQALVTRSHLHRQLV